MCVVCTCIKLANSDERIARNERKDRKARGQALFSLTFILLVLCSPPFFFFWFCFVLFGKCFFLDKRPERGIGAIEMCAWILKAAALVWLVASSQPALLLSLVPPPFLYVSVRLPGPLSFKQSTTLAIDPVLFGIQKAMRRGYTQVPGAKIAASPFARPLFPLSMSRC